jgi:hypothetical protein
MITPVLDKVSIGVDRIGFREFLLNQTNDSLQILLILKISVSDRVLVSLQNAKINPRYSVATAMSLPVICFPP